MLLLPSNNKKILVLDKIKQKICDDFINNKLHHNLLITGIKGIGKATLCYHIANVMLNSKISQTNDLLDDNKTFNLIKTKKHPDLLVLEKMEDPKTHKLDTEIKIDSTENSIKNFISLLPFISTNKVVLIDSIDEMNVFAQNFILKILEDSYTNTYFLLVCHNKNNILKTIYSRCVEINIKHYSFSEWKNILMYVLSDQIESISEKELYLIYSLSNASISASVEIINNNILSLYSKIEEICTLPTFNIDIISNFADLVSKTDDTYNIFIDFFFHFLHSLLRNYSEKNNNFFYQINSMSFIKNNSQSFLEKINSLISFLESIKKFNLNKKHSIIVLFQKLYE